MNKDIPKGNWKQIRCEVEAWWGKLTDNDLQRAAGKYKAFPGVLQEKYGDTHERTGDEMDTSLMMYEVKPRKKTQPIPGK